MEELDALLRREIHYQCEDYFTPHEVALAPKNRRRKGLESLPAPVLISMLNECASLVTDISSAREVGSSLVGDSVSVNSTGSAPGSPSSVSAIHAQSERQKSTRSAHAPLGSSQNFVFWRKQMCNWAFVVVNNFDIDKQTVSVAFNILDRYVVLEQNVPGAPIITREDYQLFAMTALYIAVKVMEPYPRKIAVDALVVMSRDFYSEEDILHTERDILMTLDWKINVPTVLAFCRNFVESMGDECEKAELERICTSLSERIVADSFFVPLKDSMIGLACVMHAAQLMGSSDEYTLQKCMQHIKRVRGNDEEASTFESILERLDQITC